MVVFQRTKMAGRNDAALAAALEQEVHELREEVTILRVEVEKLTNLVSSLMVQQKPQPLCVQPPQGQHQPLRI